MIENPGLLPVLTTGLVHRYDGDQRGAIAGIDLAVERGEVVALVGPSGAGKSTLLTLLDGRLRGWHGAASVLGRALRPDRAPDRARRAEVGFVFQEFALIERASVWRNVLNGRLGRTDPLASLFGRFTAADEAATDAALTDTGIAELRDRRVDQLSGGQRQRVAIARCLAQEPQLILADEPVSNLDPLRSERILRLLADTARKRRATLLFSSHQPELAGLVADRIVALRDGRVVFDGPPDLLTAAQLGEIYRDEPSEARAPEPVQ
jgi:phosphonate transport system ATP-binding protein